MKRILLHAILLNALGVLLSMHPAQKWTLLLDNDLSQWERYLSYNHIEGYNGKPPTDANGKNIPPIGFNKDDRKVFSILTDSGEPVLRISGETYGCLFTQQSYKNYHLKPDYLSLFNGTNKNSSEIILAAQYIKNTYPNSNATWLGAPSVGGWSCITPLKALVDAYETTDGLTAATSPLYDPKKPFENRDPRLKMTIVTPNTALNGFNIDATSTTSIDGLSKNNATFTGYYFRKYIPTDIEGNWDVNSYNDDILIRYAEVLLIYAEAKIELGQIDNTVYSAINSVRQRPGVAMPAVSSTTHPTQTAMRELIRRERRVEFALEEHRFFDIRRWQIAATVMSGSVYGILNDFNSQRADYGQNVLVEARNFNAARDYLWAIPQNEVDINENLQQNPNW